jgi:hypothetical protein
MSQQLLHIRLESDTYDRVKAEADRQDVSIAEFIRKAVEKALSPAQVKAEPKTPEVDPVLQAMANGIRREAASRGLSPGMIVQLWFNMMRPPMPTLEAQPDPLADGLKLNIKISDEPKDSK